MATFDQRQQVVITQYNIAQGISEEQYQRLGEELGVTRSALRSFFKILEQQQVPPEDLDHTLRQIATSYKELHARLQRFTADDPAVLALKQQARGAVEAGEFTRAEVLLNEASTKDLEAAQQLQEIAATRLRSAAASRAANGDLKRTQLAYDEAIGYYRQAVHVVESIPTARQELAEYLNAWGIASYEAGQYAEAELLLQRALALQERALGPEHPDTATSLNNLAEVYQAQRRYGEAEPLFQRALAIREQALGPEHPDTATSLHNLAGLYRAQGRYADAEPLYQHALALTERVLGPDDPAVEVVRQNYLVLLRAMDRHTEADTSEARDSTGQTRSADTATGLSNLAGLYREQGRLADAEPLYKRALAINERELGPNHPDVVTGLNNLALLYYTQGRYAEAEPLYQRALAIAEQALGAGHPLTATVRANYASLLRHRQREAAPFASLGRRLRAWLARTREPP